MVFAATKTSFLAVSQSLSNHFLFFDLFVLCFTLYVFSAKHFFALSHKTSVKEATALSIDEKLLRLKSLKINAFFEMVSSEFKKDFYMSIFSRCCSD